MTAHQTVKSLATSASDVATDGRTEQQNMEGPVQQGEDCDEGLTTLILRGTRAQSRICRSQSRRGTMNQVEHRPLAPVLDRYLDDRCFLFKPVPHKFPNTFHSSCYCPIFYQDTCIRFTKTQKQNFIAIDIYLCVKFKIFYQSRLTHMFFVF